MKMHFWEKRICKNVFLSKHQVSASESGFTRNAEAVQDTGKKSGRSKQGWTRVCWRRSSPPPLPLPIKKGIRGGPYFYRYTHHVSFIFPWFSYFSLFTPLEIFRQPYLKILDFAKLFVADAPMKKNNIKLSFDPYQSSFGTRSTKMIYTTYNL